MKQTQCIVGWPVVSHMGRLIALACFVGLAGCGQKGPLYLPPPSAQPTTAPQPPSTTTVDPEEATTPTR